MRLIKITGFQQMVSSGMKRYPVSFLPSDTQSSSCLLCTDVCRYSFVNPEKFLYTHYWNIFGRVKNVSFCNSFVFLRLMIIILLDSCRYFQRWMEIKNREALFKVFKCERKYEIEKVSYWGRNLKKQEKSHKNRKSIIEPLTRWFHNCTKTLTIQKHYSCTKTIYIAFSL